MINKEEITEKITNIFENAMQQMGEAINEYIENKQAEPSEPSGLWKPKKYETYYYIDDFNNICDREFCNTELDNARKLIGNCFRTQEDAEKALDCLKIRRQLKDIAERLNGGREIDWSNADDKYCLSFYFDEEITTTAQKNSKKQGAIYCLDENFKDVAIAEIGEERLKEYLKEC